MQNATLNSIFSVQKSALLQYFDSLKEVELNSFEDYLIVGCTFSMKGKRIMRKTLTAVAVLSAFAGSALAADIALYGVIDLGLQYQNIKHEMTSIDQDPSFDKYSEIEKDTWGLESGSNSGSRWGIKGSEQISEGLTVGFQLEQGFNADAGDYADEDRFFNRESRLYVQTPYGEIGMGRMGALDSGLGSYDMMEAASAFGTGWGSTIGASTAILRGMGDRMDNTITYKSPEFGGVTILAQVSLSPTSDEDEGSSDSDRYYALGAKGQWNALEAALVVSSTDYDREYVNSHGGIFPSHSKVVSGYVSYDCGFAKTTLGAQYYDDMRDSPFEINNPNEYDALIHLSNIISTKGYGVMLSTVVPLAGGEFLASAGYADYELTVSSNITYDTFNVGIGYQYPLSKRTFVYTGAGYTKFSGDYTLIGAKDSSDKKTIEVVSGLVHTF